MKLKTIKTKTIEETTAAALDTSIQTFVTAQAEATFVSLSYQRISGQFSVVIVYAS